MNSEKAKDGKFKNIIGKNKNIIIIASTVIVLGAGIIGAYIINVENKVAGWKERIYTHRLRPLLQGTTAKPWQKVKDM